LHIKLIIICIVSNIQISKIQTVKILINPYKKYCDLRIFDIFYLVYEPLMSYEEPSIYFFLSIFIEKTLKN